MFYSGIFTDGGGGRRDSELREAASLRQQRRMKQSVQFIHKDSADLLPLDGMKKLGTSKDTQPHNVLQRRLLESHLTKLRSRTAWNPKSDQSSHSRRSEEDALYVWAQCAGKEMKLKIDTSCQHSLISSACLDRLGMKDHFRHYKKEEEAIFLSGNRKPIGHIDHLPLMLGTVALDCSTIVIDDKESCVSLGLRALRSLKSVINLEKNQLEVGRTGRDPLIVPLVAPRSTTKEPSDA